MLYNIATHAKSISLHNRPKRPPDQVREIAGKALLDPDEAGVCPMDREVYSLSWEKASHSDG